MTVNRFAEAEMMRLAASAVHKIDLLGSRGTERCSIDEIDAMACLLVTSGVLRDPHEAKSVTETPIFKTRRNRNA